MYRVQRKFPQCSRIDCAAHFAYDDARRPAVLRTSMTYATDDVTRHEMATMGTMITIDLLFRFDVALSCRVMGAKHHHVENGIHSVSQELIG